MSYPHQPTLTWLILYQIMVILFTLGWLIATLLPNAMMFDAGYTKAILIDALMTLTPIVIWWSGAILAWRWYRKNHYQRCLLAMIIPLLLTLITIALFWWLS